MVGLNCRVNLKQRLICTNKLTINVPLTRNSRVANGSVTRRVDGMDEK